MFESLAPDPVFSTGTGFRDELFREGPPHIWTDSHLSESAWCVWFLTLGLGGNTRRWERTGQQRRLNSPPSSQPPSASLRALSSSSELLHAFAPTSHCLATANRPSQPTPRPMASQSRAGASEFELVTRVQLHCPKKTQDESVHLLTFLEEEGKVERKNEKKSAFFSQL